MKVGTIFGLNSPKAPTDFKGALSAFNQYLGWAAKKGPEPELLEKVACVFDVPTLVGIEVEVENIKSEPSIPKFWMQEADGSLRNHGKEYKSVPLEPEQAFSAIWMLWQVLYKASTAKPDFSWRTSIHVHVNAIEMDDDEFQNLLLLSLVFEEMMFHLVGSEREDSNFCAPLCRSILTDTLKGYFSGKTTLKSLFKTWNAGGGMDAGSGLYKYASVNLSRLGDLGTVEFRHLGGTGNMVLLFQWLALILQMYRAAVLNSPIKLHSKIKMLNSTKDYEEFVEDIFGKKLMKFLVSKNFKEMLYENITLVKEMLIKSPEFPPCEAGSALHEYAEVAQKRQKRRQEAPKPKKL